jgi:hypothetical protein
MSADPLRPFRPPGSKPAAPPRDSPASEPDGYRAFQSGGKPARLEMRMAGGVSVFKAYNAITEIIYDRKTEGLIALQYSVKQFIITGQNLEPVLDAILAGTCEWVAELASGESAASGKPSITKITAGAVPAMPQPKPAAPKPAPKDERG